jgi:putative transposase
MPYEYRLMTPEERTAVIEERRRQGYPLHAPPHPYREAGWYFITATNFEHAHIIEPAERRTMFEEQLLQSMQAIGSEVGGWVVLPNHYHILISVRSLDSISAALKQLHGTTSRNWNLEDSLTGKRKVWYKFRDRYIRNERHYHQALNYIHYNPVKHGYVESPYDWPWSSVHIYCDTYGQRWLREQWVAYPIDDFGKDWGAWDE